jgi:hypothetical protein
MGASMSHAEEIEFLDGIREAAIRRLEECEQEASLTEDLEGSKAGNDEIARRRKKLRSRADRYRGLSRRIEAEAKSARQSRLDALLKNDFARLSTDAIGLHRRARRLEGALQSVRERYRGLRMRHLALEREAAVLSRSLGLPHPDQPEPPEIRSDLGAFAEGEEG